MNTKEKLTLSLEEAHANRFPLREKDLEWMTLVVTWPSNTFGLSRRFNNRGSSLKMSQDFCHLRGDRTLVSSSERWQVSGMGSPGEFWTLNSSESRKDVEDSLLSDILEEIGEVPQRYYLSPRACNGILRRAQRRGKALPPSLEAALQERAKHYQEEEE